MTVGIGQQRQYSLSGPVGAFDPARWPVRGDLAHIKLAGRCFVPHYAVPELYRLASGGAALRIAPDRQAEARAHLAGGTDFNVLDIAGDWVWGQAEEDGCVGYLPADTVTLA